MREETCIPNPEFLIKSIAEQGYTFEASVADLIDNSISAGARRVEVLVGTDSKPFQLFLADDGNGMTKEDLKRSMHFPSASPDASRNVSDLGRFGLGLKTASFAQTRCLTVLSKKPNEKRYNGRTWDVEHLRQTGRWELITNTDEEVNHLLIPYRRLSNGFNSHYEDYSPNTIIIWNGLYKFEKEGTFNDAVANLQRELTETTKEHLSLIFHRFMEQDEPLQIRLNNVRLSPFNPFPKSARHISTLQKNLFNNRLKLEGFILPNQSIKESKGVSEWTLKNKSLMDMEGMYVYRADRIIVYGGWNGLIKKSPRLQLARLKVEVGNGIDHLFHLNVAKSSIMIPFGERFGFIKYVSELKTEAEKEYFNLEIKGRPSKTDNHSLFKNVATSNGISLIINTEFPLLKMLETSLSNVQQQQLRMLIRVLVTTINKVRKVHADDSFLTLVEKEEFAEDDVTMAIQQLITGGLSKESIRLELIPAMGIDINSLPQSILSLL